MFQTYDRGERYKQKEENNESRNNDSSKNEILAALSSLATFIDLTILLNWVLLALFCFSRMRLFPSILSVLVEEIIILFGK